MSRCRNWVFTLNNPESNEVPKSWLNVKYLIYQREKGAEGTEHLQGYVVFANTVQLGGLKKVCPTAHWEPRRGSHAQAKEYCSKTDSRIAGPWEFGEEPQKQGKRNDLDALKEDVDAGMPLVELADKHFSVMAAHSRWVREYRVLKGTNKRSWITFTTVIWGPPGVGKTQRLVKSLPLAFWMKKPAQGQAVFFDGYDGEEDVVIDEFYGWIPRDLLCRMCDSSPLTVDTKGGAVSFCPKRIWITSNHPPREWYPKAGLGPMERRLSGDMGKIEFMGPAPMGNQEADLDIMASAAGMKRQADAAKQNAWKHRDIREVCYDSDVDVVDECAPGYARRATGQYS